jgi:hypothetical protein
MIQVLTVVLVGLFCFGLYKIFTLKNFNALVIFIFSVFGSAYYLLPLLFRNSTGLGNIDDFILSEFIFYNMLYLVAFVIGISALKVNFKSNKRVSFYYLNTFISNNINIVFYGCLIINLVIDNFFGMSVYNDGVTEESVNIPFKGLFSMISLVTQGLICVVLTISTNEKSKGNKWKVFFFIVLIISQTLSIQRLQTIRIIVVFSIISYSIFQNKKLLKRIFILLPIILVVTSPIYTFMRYNIYLNNGNGFTSDFALEQTKVYMNGDSNMNDYLSQGLEIVLERADLVATSISTLSYIENEDFNHAIYISSIFQQYIPGFLVNNKSYPMSDDGTPYGELSIISYGLKNGHGKLGSLTIFGAISALREGGVLWVPVNGFLSGLLIIFCIKKLSEFGYFGIVLISLLIFNSVIKKVPASLGDVIINLVIVFYLLLLASIVNKFLQISK